MERSVTLAIVGSLALLAVATASPVLLFRSVRAARPQFPFFNPYVNIPNGNPLQAGIGVQTPVAGVDLSVPSGLTVTRGQQQAAPAQPAQPKPAYQNNVAPYGVPQGQGLGNRYDGSAYNGQPSQSQGLGSNFNGASYNGQPSQGQGFGNNFNGASSNGQPAQGDGLGTRIDDPSDIGQPAPPSPEEFPCENYDPSLSPPSDGDENNASENPCAGIGGGNKINPKQAALLSLVG
uniref:Uncharacterized protein n=1 Tax=Anopheles atroparvus TaxID=41427 RepID=A0AAG5D0N2_ANOAO